MLSVRELLSLCKVSGAAGLPFIRDVSDIGAEESPFGVLALLLFELPQLVMSSPATMIPVNNMFFMANDF